MLIFMTLLFWESTKKQISRAAQELFRRYKNLRSGLTESEFIKSMLSKYAN